MVSLSIFWQNIWTWIILFYVCKEEKSYHFLCRKRPTRHIERLYVVVKRLSPSTLLLNRLFLSPQKKKKLHRCEGIKNEKVPKPSKRFLCLAGILFLKQKTRSKRNKSTRDQADPIFPWYLSFLVFCLVFFFLFLFTPHKLNQGVSFINLPKSPK